MSGLPNLSIVVPCHDEPLVGETVAAALERARVEGAPDAEIIVVGQVDRRLLPPDPAIRLIAPEQPLWPAAARNRGLSAATGERIVFLDADCTPLEGWCRAILATDGIAGGGIVSPTDDLPRACYNLAFFREYLADLPPSPRRFLASYCLWGPRHAFEDVGGFDEAMRTAEDLDLTIRLAQAGWPLRFAPEARVLHRPRTKTAWDVVRGGWRHGGNSMRARRAYPEAFATPGLATNALALLLAAPVVSAYFLARTYLEHPRYRTLCLRCAPPIFLFRVAWCAAAALTARRRLASTTA